MLDMEDYDFTKSDLYKAFSPLMYSMQLAGMHHVGQKIIPLGRAGTTS